AAGGAVAHTRGGVIEGHVARLTGETGALQTGFAGGLYHSVTVVAGLVNNDAIGYGLVEIIVQELALCQSRSRHKGGAKAQGGQCDEAERLFVHGLWMGLSDICMNESGW